MDRDHVETGAGLDLAGVCVVAGDTRNTSGGQRGARAATPRCGRRDAAAAPSRPRQAAPPAGAVWWLDRFLVGPAQDQARTVAPGRAGTAAPGQSRDSGTGHKRTT